MEQSEINLLLNKGFEIQTKLFGRSKKWICKKMTLGRLIELSDIFVKIKEGDEPVDSADVLASQYQSVRNNAKLSAMAMAVCFTDHKWLRPLLTQHFLKNIEPIELLNFSTKMIAQADYKNFTLSIALMNSNRVTKANPVEKIKA